MEKEYDLGNQNSISYFYQEYSDGSIYLKTKTYSQDMVSDAYHKLIPLEWKIINSSDNKNVRVILNNPENYYPITGNWWEGSNSPSKIFFGMNYNSNYYSAITEAAKENYMVKPSSNQKTLKTYFTLPTVDEVKTIIYYGSYSDKDNENDYGSISSENHFYWTSTENNNNYYVYYKNYSYQKSIKSISSYTTPLLYQPVIHLDMSKGVPQNINTTVSTEATNEDAPKNLIGRPVPGANILTWDYLSTNNYGVKITRQELGKNEEVIATLEKDATKYIDKVSFENHLKNDTVYTYRVYSLGSLSAKRTVETVSSYSEISIRANIPAQGSQISVTNSRTSIQSKLVTNENGEKVILITMPEETYPEDEVYDTVIQFTPNRNLPEEVFSSKVLIPAGTRANTSFKFPYFGYSVSISAWKQYYDKGVPYYSNSDNVYVDGSITGSKISHAAAELGISEDSEEKIILCWKGIDLSSTYTLYRMPKILSADTNEFNINTLGYSTYDQWNGEWCPNYFYKATDSNAKKESFTYVLVTYHKEDDSYGISVKDHTFRKPVSQNAFNVVVSDGKAYLFWNKNTYGDFKIVQKIHKNGSAIPGKYDDEIELNLNDAYTLTDTTSFNAITLSELCLSNLPSGNYVTFYWYDTVYNGTKVNNECEGFSKTVYIDHEHRVVHPVQRLIWKPNISGLEYESNYNSKIELKCLYTEGESTPSYQYVNDIPAESLFTITGDMLEVSPSYATDKELNFTQSSDKLRLYNSASNYSFYQASVNEDLTKEDSKVLLGASNEKLYDQLYISTTDGTNRSISLKVDVYAVVTFDANGGTLSDSNTSQKLNNSNRYNNLEKPSSSSLSRLGYKTKDGTWFTDKEGNLSAPNSNSRYTKNTTLYAGWEAKEYDVYYNFLANGNNASNPSKYKITDGIVTLQNAPNNNSPKAEFEGWYKDYTQGKNSYSNKVSILDASLLTIDSSSITLYARYKRVQKITYANADGGASLTTSNPNEYEILDGDKVDIILEAPTAPTGKVFAGWYMNQNCTEESKLVDNKLTLYGNRTTNGDTVFAKFVNSN